MWDCQVITIAANPLNFQNWKINNQEPYSHSRFNADRLTKNYILILILWNVLFKNGQKFPYLCNHDISHCIGYKLLIHSYTGINMMLFLLPESYFFILGILFTFDLFVPGGILRGVLIIDSLKWFQKMHNKY